MKMIYFDFSKPSIIQTDTEINYLSLETKSLDRFYIHGLYLNTL